jgi:hypothetical protein
MESRLDEQVFNKLMIALFDAYGKKLKPTTLELFMDSYYEELKNMPTEKFQIGIMKVVATVNKNSYDFPTVSKIKELGYGATDEQRVAYQEQDKSRTLEESKLDKTQAKQQWENLQLLAKCVSLGIPKEVIAKQAATGSLLDLLKKYAPAVVMTKEEKEMRRSDVKENALRLISQWRTEGAI